MAINFLFINDPYEAKYNFLINIQESLDLMSFKDLEYFIKYSHDMNDIYKNIEDVNRNKKPKILIVCDDMVAMLSNGKLNLIVTKLFIRGRKLNIALAFITQSCFSLSKNIRLNSTQ